MSGPVRVQLSRAKGWRMPENTVVVSRPSKYGNPWQEGDPGLLNYGGWIKLPMTLTRAGVVDRYRRWLAGEFQTADGAIRTSHPIYECVVAPPTPAWAADLSPLRGKNLACWCRLPKPGEPDICHAAVLLELANRGD